MATLPTLVPAAAYMAVVIGAALDHSGVPTALILSAGVAAGGLLDIRVVLVANFLGAFGGDLFLYVVGRYGGRAFLLAGARRFGVSAARIESAEDLIERHGVPLLLFGRYYLLVGRYVPLVCGASRMPFRRFAGYSAVGLAALTILVGLATYFLGQGVNGFAQNPLAAVWVCLAGLGVQLVVLVFTIALRRARRAHARRET